MEVKKINVIITDDHKLFRKGICALLSDFDFINDIQEAENGEELIELLKTSNSAPDIILLDLRMPQMDGIEAQKIIKKLYPDIKIIILTMDDDEQLILHLINEGVNGYLFKNADPEEMEMALKKVNEKGFYFSANISELVMRNLVKGQSKKNNYNADLSERELLVLELICKEYTAAEIGRKLDLSVRTIEGYRRKLLDKTGATNMAGLVVFAIKYDLVQI